ncbi:hypothetical protein BDQ17DRAFT_1386518 [Cyathus striatus]|nr:hypothetical protein BDQ17DRAFT_1386518 [Cyathus striatus]
MALPAPGTRIAYHGFLGTIRFVGTVLNTTGLWLGVEWDLPDRGKHDGLKDGIRYFTCRVPNSGSFIRPSSHVYYGVSFLDALLSKYIENPHGSESQEKVLLGSSNGSIQVEAVNLDKIRAKLSNLMRLREVSLDKQGVARSNPIHSIHDTCPNIQGLDLSANLLPSWDEVALIARELPVLQRLAMNQCRLELPKQMGIMEASFSQLLELQLNGTLITWPEMQAVTVFMSKLNVVELGYNHLETLATDDVIRLANDSSIITFNLDSNACLDWNHVCDSISPYMHVLSSLNHVILASNKISVIPFPTSHSHVLLQLRHLSLSHNLLKSWIDVDALASWCPKLEKFGSRSRAFVIARVPSIVFLDGTLISKRERTDSELFYLSYIAANEPSSTEVCMRAHPRWQELCALHGQLNKPLHGSQNKLGSRLTELVMYRCTQPIEAQLNTHNVRNSSPLLLSILPTMSLKQLRMKLCKLSKENSRNCIVRCWLKLSDGSVKELEKDSDTKDLSWLGIEKSSEVLFYIQNK